MKSLLGLSLSLLAACTSSVEVGSSGGTMTTGNGGMGGTLTTGNGGMGGTVTAASSGGSGGAMTTTGTVGSGGMPSSSTTGGEGGAAMSCASPADCPDVDALCVHRTCVSGQCGVAFDPMGTPIPGLEIHEDCLFIVCDGADGLIEGADGADVHIDGNPCTADVCNAGMPQNPPLPAGTPCSVDGGTQCDGKGACVACISSAECPAGVCWMGHCPAMPCADGVKDGTETDVDCGGTCPGKCRPGQHCQSGSDCAFGFCNSSSICSLPDCIDFVKDGSETDTDCGGPICIPCSAGLKCLSKTDCASHICTGGTCAAATCTDGVENGLESDVDCGGGCPKCVVGKKCKVGFDCQSGVCSGSLCQP